MLEGLGPQLLLLRGEGNAQGFPVGAAGPLGQVALLIQLCDRGVRLCFIKAGISHLGPIAGTDSAAVRCVARANKESADSTAARCKHTLGLSALKLRDLGLRPAQLSHHGPCGVIN